jgi:hypothetical protein
MGHREAPSADRIAPEFQALKVGDTILGGPPGTVFFTVCILQPKRAIVLYSDSHPRYLGTRSIRDNPKYGIYWGFAFTFGEARHNAWVHRGLALLTRYLASVQGNNVGKPRSGLVVSEARPRAALPWSSPPALVPWGMRID